MTIYIKYTISHNIQIMNTPDQKRRIPKLDYSGVIRMMRSDPDPFASPGKDGIVDGSPISMPKKKQKNVHSPLPNVLIVNDPNATPQSAVVAQP